MDSKTNTPCGPTAGDIFDCKQCGDCCRGFGGTYVTDQDIENISAYIKADPATFVEKYCDYSGSRPVLTLAENGCCTFLIPKSSAPSTR